MWVAYALGCSAGLMVISQLVPFAKSVGIAAAALSTMTLVVGAFGNASGRHPVGLDVGQARPHQCTAHHDRDLHRRHAGVVCRGSNVALLYLAVFVVYWCYGTQLSVNGVATSDFWGTKNAGINYGMLFTAWGVAGIIGPRIGGVLVRPVSQLPGSVLHRGRSGRRGADLRNAGQAAGGAASQQVNLERTHHVNRHSNQQYRLHPDRKSRL